MSRAVVSETAGIGARGITSPSGIIVSSRVGFVVGGVKLAKTPAPRGEGTAAEPRALRAVCARKMTTAHALACGAAARAPLLLIF